MNENSISQEVENKIKEPKKKVEIQGSKVSKKKNQQKIDRVKKIIVQYDENELPGESEPDLSENEESAKRVKKKQRNNIIKILD